MRRVYQYALNLCGVTRLDLPVGAQAVHAGEYGMGASIWAHVDPDVDTERRTFICAFTSENIWDDDANHISTFTERNGRVFHVFEVKL